MDLVAVFAGCVVVFLFFLIRGSDTNDKGRGHREFGDSSPRERIEKNDGGKTRVRGTGGYELTTRRKADLEVKKR